jgi:hypothetical protein
MCNPQIALVNIRVRSSSVEDTPANAYMVYYEQRELAGVRQAGLEEL